MKITGTYLNTTLAKRIALILFAAALVPASLISGLMYKNLVSLDKEYGHKAMVDNAQDYALTAMANLKYARTSLNDVALRLSENEGLYSHFNDLKQPGNHSLILVDSKGEVLRQSGIAGFPVAELQKLIQARPADVDPSKSWLLAIPTRLKNPAYSMAIAVPAKTAGNQNALLVGELETNYIWGDPAEYPFDTAICAYNGALKNKQTLFCSGEDVLRTGSSMEESENIASWELFLRAEFQSEPWVFVSKQINYSGIENSSSLGSDLLGISSFSLLIIALLSLMQIRKTMGPLEQLIEGTRKISKGEFAQVNVRADCEFGELANAFNGMSSDIQRQLETLQSLSAIDREIVSRLDVDQLAELVLARIQQLRPDAVLILTCLSEKADAEAQCCVKILENGISCTSRMPLSLREINIIKSYGTGQVVACRKDSRFTHESFMAGYGVDNQWVLPIFWQGEICAYLAVGSRTPLDVNDKGWDEIRELANRIGIAISAEAREEQLLLQAQYDNLTGLPNRILLQDRLRQAMEHTDRTGDPMWVVFVDLDRFKYVNDSLGHHVGDELLIQISKRLQLCIRDTDTVARFGGDEFIVILQGAMDDSLRMGVLHRLIDAVSQPVKIKEQEIIITCSLGIAVYPTDGSSAETIVRHADIAMYRAKELGRNNFQFFTQAMNDKVADRLLMEGHLRRALERNELLLHYQPKVDLRTRKIVGMEALIRWNSKELGFISPAQFIPLAEETGLIVEIGEWALRTACSQAVAWENAGLGQLLMSVNLSSRQFRQANLSHSIQAILEETGLDAGCLELELTESLIMGDVENSVKILREIKSLGIQLSVDDFGTGYSSLAYLKNLPLDTLKIDKSFTDDIVMHTDQAPIVASIISLARNLNLKVVAEGVESHEQVMYLTAHDCDEMQGYYFSRPEPARSIESMLRKDRQITAPHLKLA